MSVEYTPADSTEEARSAYGVELAASLFDYLSFQQLQDM